MACLIASLPCSFGCQHFHFTFWFLQAASGFLCAGILGGLTRYAILHFDRTGSLECINSYLNLAVFATLGIVWILKCNHL